MYSCHGDHMQEDKGHWGAFVRVCVCVCVCAVLTCLQPFKCFRNEFKVYVIISTHAELNHGDILQRFLFDEDSSSSLMKHSCELFGLFSAICVIRANMQRLQGFPSNTVHFYWIINRSTCPSPSCLPFMTSKLGEDLHRQAQNEKKT